MTGMASINPKSWWRITARKKLSVLALEFSRWKCIGMWYWASKHALSIV